MKSFTNYGRRKYLFLLPIMILIAGAMYNWHAAGEIENALIREKYQEISSNVDIIATLVNSYVYSDEDWGEYDYEGMINKLIEVIREAPGIFAHTYKISECGLIALSDPYSNQPSFDPRNYAEFLNGVMGNERGKIILDANAEGHRSYEMHVHFQWIPSFDKDIEMEERVLVVAAVSYHSITNPLALWVSVGQWVGLVANFVLGVWLVFLACKFKCSEN